MTQDEIIEMAEKAGFDCYGKHITWDDVICTDELKAFAKLVADKAIAELESQERNFCSRCGKRTKDLTTIHTCTPPQD
jgi:hypothetical protein